MRGRRWVTGVAVAGLVFGSAVTAGGTPASAAAPSQQAQQAQQTRSAVQWYEPPHRHAYPADASVPATLDAWKRTPDGRAQLLRAEPTARAAETPAVGTKRLWPAFDFETESRFLKEFTLRHVGRAIEVWVASGAGPDGIVGTDYREQDCRNVQPGVTTVTDAQVRSLAKEYDTNILPKESKAFSVAPARDGSVHSADPTVKGLDFSGTGSRLVTLVDNIRDAAFYHFPQQRSGVAGYFSGEINEQTDRNVMTIDSEDWIHTTGANPPNNPNDDLCKSATAQPRFYESVFAHEYQHLLQYYVDPAEVTFLNEGLSDYAMDLTGYVRNDRSVFEPHAQGSIYCFQGFGTLESPYNPHPVACGGPANSLTQWGDQGAETEIVADYGTACSFLLYLRHRFGASLVERIHRDKAAQGLASVQRQLDTVKGKPRVAAVLHDYQLMTLVDKIVGTKGATLTGAAKSLVSVANLKASVNLLNPAAFLPVGASPNGADYVALRGTGAATLTGGSLRTLTFAGSRSLPPVPMAWQAVPAMPLLPPTLSLPAFPGVPPVEDVTPPQPPSGLLDNPALFSGNTPETDASAVFRVTVPTANPTLTFTSYYSLEENFDYGFVVISTDGGKTYTSLANANTKATVDPAPAGNAFTGASGAAQPQSFDLAAYAGKSVLLGFRFLSDPAVNTGGWYVDDVAVGGTLVSDGTSTAPFRTVTQVRPLPVAGWSFQIVGIDEARKRVHVERLTGFTTRLTKAQIARFRGYPLVVAVVGFDDPREQATVSAPYLVRANAVGQAGGRE